MCFPILNFCFEQEFRLKRIQYLCFSLHQDLPKWFLRHHSMVQVSLVTTRLYSFDIDRYLPEFYYLQMPYLSLNHIEQFFPMSDQEWQVRKLRIRDNHLYLPNHTSTQLEALRLNRLQWLGYLYCPNSFLTLRHQKY